MGADVGPTWQQLYLMDIVDRYLWIDNQTCSSSSSVTNVSVCSFFFLAFCLK